jgi:hypothetical protein
MTSLPSNNYADRAHLAGADESTSAGEFTIAQAILAVAEEQRTANLIALMQGSRNGAQIMALRQQIANRLGLTGEDF